VVGADGAAFFDVAAGEVVAGVGADAVEDVDLALMEEDGKGVAVDFDEFAGSFGEFVEFAEAGPGHCPKYNREGDRAQASEAIKQLQRREEEDFYRLPCLRRMVVAGSNMDRRCALPEVLAPLFTFGRAVAYGREKSTPAASYL
jgi:hypothetical protein